MNQSERISDPEDADNARLDELSGLIRCAFPGIVTKVNLEAQTVEVKIALMGSVTDETDTTTYVQYPILPDVPIVWPRAGGLAITLPVAVGDECLVVFADRCIDAWWQSGGVQRPMDSRKHDFSDAFAIFGVTSQPRRLPSVSADAIEIRDDARANWLSLKPGALDINIEGDVTVNCKSSKVTAASSTLVTCPSNKVDGPLTVTGLITGQGGIVVSGGGGATVTGSFTLNGGLTSTEDVVAGGISLMDHVHTEQGDGSDTSGPH